MIGAAYTMTTKRERLIGPSKQKRKTLMYVGLKQPRGDGELYVTPARAAAKETKGSLAHLGIFTRDYTAPLAAIN